MQSAKSVIKGLDGVLACTTAICSIDGPAGELRYRGYEIRDLVGRAPFADVAQLLWLGRWPLPGERDHFDSEAQSRRPLPPAVTSLFAALPSTAHPLAIVRTALSLEGALDEGAETNDAAEVRDRAITVYARSATLVGALSCRARGEQIRSPRQDLDHASNLLWMATGVQPDDLTREALDALLVTYAEHELNASTFAARTVVSTLSDYWSAITGAVGALKGSLHGGAVDDAIKLFVALGSPSAVPAYLDEVAAHKAKVPGFGHRVYRTRDPRAVGMERYAELLSTARGDSTLLDTARTLESTLGERKGLSANVDYYGALVMHLLGLPHDVFSTLIVASRFAGWTAHIDEQLADNKLIRPRGVYVGEGPRSLSNARAAG